MKKKNSLFFKLLMIFSILGLGIILTFIFSFRTLGNRSYKKSFYRNMGNYINYIIKDIPRPITQVGLQQIQKKINIGIAYNQMKSDPTLPSLDQLDRKVKVSPHLTFARKKRKRFAIYEKDGETFIFALNFDSQRESSPLPLMVACLSSLFLLFLAHWKIKRLFSPLESIKQGAAHFAQGNFDYPIPVKGKSQLAELAHSVQDMGNKIQKMLSSKRELLLAIAHELKTPLTRAKLHLELIDDPRKQELLDNLNEMSDLVHDILESERLKENHQIINLQQTSLKVVVEQTIQKFFKHDSLDLNLQEVSLNLDSNRYTLVIKNLIKNALEYGTGHVTVELNQHSLKVINTGPTIDAKDLSKLTEPFYRADSGRSRKQDGSGSGLGLYLSSQIITAHHHHLSISSENDKTICEIQFNT